MGRIEQSPERFEIWDGGHCYVRLHLDKSNGRIAVLRLGHSLHAQEFIEIGKWAALVQGKKAIKAHAIREVD